jgi:hypothetical protein
MELFGEAFSMVLKNTFWFDVPSIREKDLSTGMYFLTTSKKDNQSQVRSYKGVRTLLPQMLSLREGWLGMHLRSPALRIPKREWFFLGKNSAS